MTMLRHDGIRFGTAFGVLLLLAGGPARSQDAEQAPRWVADVPRGTAPVLDGTIGTDEWADANAVELSGGGTVWLKHDGSSLYLGLRGEAGGVGMVCVVEGGQIHLLQASDGIASAVFAAEETGWSPTATFKPSLRQKGMSKSIQSLRDRYFEQNGWVATNRAMGADTDIEYRLSMASLDGSSPSIAIALSYLSGTESRGDDWPHDLDDGCNSPNVVRGGAPKAIAFDPTSWGVLRFAGD